MPNRSTPGIERNAAPYLHGTEYAALAAVLAAGHYGHTEVTEAFEREVAAFLGVPEVVAVASGTAALHLALRAAGIGPGDEVLVPSLTFCASVQAVLAAGAQPRFLDVDPTTLCVTGEHVRTALTPATRAVMPVLYGGRPVDLTALRAEFADRGIVVVEDAAHAFGSVTLDGTPVGATGNLTCFSLGPIKNLTCGQGGLIVPRDAEEAERARSLRGLGIVETSAIRAAATSYTVAAAGWREQMSALNAAIGRAQLSGFGVVAARRKQLWRAYRTALSTVKGVRVVDVDVDHAVPSLCAVLVLTQPRDAVFHHLRGQGIGVGAHYPPNHLQPAFATWRRTLPATESVAGKILTLPFHPHLDPADVERTVVALECALATVKALR
nr:DegT/DnrJ/EryC1/StrS family aminotransferase [Streptoalloteichus tenebrarius]